MNPDDVLYERIRQYGHYGLERRDVMYQQCQ